MGKIEVVDICVKQVKDIRDYVQLSIELKSESYMSKRVTAQMSTKEARLLAYYILAEAEANATRSGE